MVSSQEFTQNYLKETLPLFETYLGPEFAAGMQAMIDVYHRGSTVFICGNGGSWGTSNHMVNDLAKGSAVDGKKRLRVIGLGDNTSLLTAYANDCGYETIFVEPLKGLFQRGDLLIAISASGNSKNVVLAADYVRQHGGKTISLTGFTGGQLRELADFPIHFKSNNYGSIEDAQLMFSHLSSQYLHQYIKTKGPELEEQK